MKNIKKISLLFLIVFAGTFFASQSQAIAATSTSYSYTPMETIPGFGTPTDFPSYVVAVYKFGLWTIGISALLMITLGGYIYLTSAGNTSQTGKAKGIITDAIIGLIMALTSWLLLYTIDPDLIKGPSLSSSSTTDTETTCTGTTTGTTSTGTTCDTKNTDTGNGTCTAPQSGDCSVASLQNTCFGSNATQASSICGAESGGSSSALSGSDKTKDGKSFSVGLFQINLTVNDINGMGCPSAFSGKNYDATVINQSLYDKCVTAAQDPATNIATACSLGSNGSNWQPWSNSKSKCGF